VITPTARDGITAPEAARLAGITYRQLDYWARRGWLRPSVEAGTGRPGRRLYSAHDVLRLAALGHLGRSGADVGQLGPQVAEVELPPDGDYLVILDRELSLEVVAASELRARLGVPGRYVIFDPAPLRREVGLLSAASPTALTHARTTCA
jgi:DNA-binding transcriptional MerR regulator